MKRLMGFWVRIRSTSDNFAGTNKDEEGNIYLAQKFKGKLIKREVL